MLDACTDSLSNATSFYPDGTSAGLSEALRLAENACCANR